MQTDGISEMFRERNAEVPHIDWEDEYQDAPAERESPSAASDDSLSQLVECAKNGDREAMNDLFKSIRAQCMAVASSVLRHSDDAQDAVQDSFLKIWKNLAIFEARSSFSTWIHRIVVNTCLDFMRRESTRPHVLSQMDNSDKSTLRTSSVSSVTPEDQVSDRELTNMVRGAVDTLPLVHKKVIKLREFDGLAYDEMAQVMDCPIGTVMSRVHHARRRLALELSSPSTRLAELYAA